MSRVIGILGTFMAALVFFLLVGFLLSLVIPILLAHLPPNVEAVLGSPIRVLEKVLPGGFTVFGIIKDVAYAAVGTFVREARAG